MDFDIDNALHSSLRVLILIIDIVNIILVTSKRKNRKTANENQNI